MKQKEIQDKIISILEQYVIRGSATDKTIDVPFTGDTKEFITHKTLGEDCDACDEVDKDLSEDFLQDDPEENGYEEGTIDGEVPEGGAENYEEIDESLFEQKKDELKPPEMDTPPDVGTEPAAATPNEVGADTGVDTTDPTAGGMNDPSMGANIPGMDQGMGMDPMGMGGMEPKTPKEIGRIFELKKIYSRLISIEQYLSFSSDEFLLKLKVYISKAIQLFETLIFNINSFKDKLDDIIVLYYTFVQTVYTVLKDHYEKNDKKDKNDKAEDK